MDWLLRVHGIDPEGELASRIELALAFALMGLAVAVVFFVLPTLV
jgi:hypothetical protein